MAAPKPLSDLEAIVDARGRWTSKWYDWLFDLVAYLANFVTGPTSALVNQWALFSGTDGKSLKAGRRVMLAAEIFYFRNGGDGTGLGAIKGTTAWGSIQDAVDHVDTNIYDNGFDVIFEQDNTATLPDTYTEASGTPIIVLNKPLPGGGRRIFRGTAVQDNLVLEASGANAACLDISEDPGIIVFENHWTFVSNDDVHVNFRAVFGQLSNDGTWHHLDAVAQFLLINNVCYFENNGDMDIEFDVESPIFNDHGIFHDNGVINHIGTRTYDQLYKGQFNSFGYLSAGTMTGTFTGARCELDADGNALRLLNGNLSGIASARGNAPEGAMLLVGGQAENVVQGSVSFSASTTATVDFTTAGKPDQFDDNYFVVFAGEEDNYLWASATTATGFTANAKISTSGTFFWVLKWR